MVTKKKQRPALQQNPVADMPPVAIVCAVESKAVTRRKVQKGGAVSLSIFRQGAQVNIVAVDEQTVLVSGRPTDEVQRLVQAIPASPPSPFQALSDLVRGQSHDEEDKRPRHAFVKDLGIPQISDAQALAKANVQRARRAR